MDNLQNVRLECLKVALVSGTPTVSEIIARSKQYEEYILREDGAKESIKEEKLKVSSSGNKKKSGNLDILS